MRRPILPTVALALVLATPASAAENVTELDRFELWNDCRPLSVDVHLQDKESNLGLTEEAIEVAVRSRLRGARIYSQDTNKTNWSLLYIHLHVVSRAYSLTFQYQKVVRDEATKMLFQTTTWISGETGTHGGLSDATLAGVAQRTDKFIDEYLRVNADACGE